MSLSSVCTRSRLLRFAVAPALALALVATAVGSPASAAQFSAGRAPVNLGAAASFAVLAAATVTNTGPTVISGDLGVSPGTAVTGFPPGVIKNGVLHSATAYAAQAQVNLASAYADAASRTPTGNIVGDLGGRKLTPGVYNGGALAITGTLTLDGQGNPDAVFIFQAASTLVTASSSRVTLTNGARACDVFWEVGSSATLGTNSSIVGNIMVSASVTATTGVAVTGRLLAKTAAVTLDTNRVIKPAGC
jgi:hypothetical protein